MDRKLIITENFIIIFLVEKNRPLKNRKTGQI